MSSDNSRSSATLDFTVPNFSTFLSNNKPVYSESKIVNFLSWKVMVAKKEQCNLLSPSLGIFLQCSHILKSKKSWSCSVKGTVGVLSPSTNPSVKDFSRSFELLFNSKAREWGFHRFISLAEVRDYIENDSITVRAHLEAGIPSPTGILPKQPAKTVGKKRKISFDTSPAEAAKPKKLELISVPALLAPQVKESDNDKQKSLETEVLKLKKDLADEKSKSKKMSEDLTMKSLELEANRLTIKNLESKIINLASMGESEKKISEISVTLNSLRSTITKLESKVATLEEGQKSDEVANVELKVTRLEKLQREVDIKLKKFDDEFKKEKRRRDSFKDLLLKAAE